MTENYFCSVTIMMAIFILQVVVVIADIVESVNTTIVGEEVFIGVIIVEVGYSIIG